MRSPVAGPTVALAAAALAVLAGAGLALAAPAPAASAAPASASTIAPLTPAEGATVAGPAELTWTEVLGTGYEVRWNEDGAVDADGVLSTAHGGRSFPGTASHLLADLTSPTYHWQVRALPAGDWSSIATFHVDVQLDTLDLPAVDEPAPTGDAPADPAPVAQPESAPAVLGGPLHGLVWVAGASTLAGLVVAVVGRERLRVRRRES